MPELPEVETIRLQLAEKLVGKQIVGIKVLLPKQFQGEVEEVIGARIIDVGRRAKILLIHLDNDRSILIHLKLTGQLIWAPKTELPGKTTHIIFEINDGRLFFNDLRAFGWVRVIRGFGDFGDFGVEPFSKDFTVEYLGRVFAGTSRPVKLVLMDQTKIAGIGNIYANEALWEAGILPAKPAKNLENLEIEKLRNSILVVLKEGIKYGGASAADEAYVKPNGSKGKYQEHFRVYQRGGQPCWRCGGLIKRVSLGGRGTFFCPVCQK
ncbi:bifunctional DNA-formamidopyrimidine glycosylase/DNA-(apurinic or apyrimidinic site) lyase [Candidatus Shapirobacteria bacterium]|nr:bifunctional DNA-formamidopyrimidine glycosylase/DNA-(apurinic or apyrimidinic site) lyase [Candidatus Shapirobacteria bacterium]